MTSIRLPRPSVARALVPCVLAVAALPGCATAIRMAPRISAEDERLLDAHVPAGACALNFTHSDAAQPALARVFRVAWPSRESGTPSGMDWVIHLSASDLSRPRSPEALAGLCYLTIGVAGGLIPYVFAGDEVLEYRLFRAADVRFESPQVFRYRFSHTTVTGVFGLLVRALPGWGAPDEAEFQRRAAAHLAVDLVRSGLIAPPPADAAR